MKKKKKEWKYAPYLKSAIRKIWRWSPKRKKCLAERICNDCHRATAKLFADHIDPVVDTQKGFEGWDPYVTRMFEGELQALCENCHKLKTNKENLARRKRRAILKALAKSETK